MSNIHSIVNQCIIENFNAQHLNLNNTIEPIAPQLDISNKFEIQPIMQDMLSFSFSFAFSSNSAFHIAQFFQNTTETNFKNTTFKYVQNKIKSFNYKTGQTNFYHKIIISNRSYINNVITDRISTPFVKSLFNIITIISNRNLNCYEQLEFLEKHCFIALIIDFQYKQVQFVIQPANKEYLTDLYQNDCNYSEQSIQQKIVKYFNDLKTNSSDNIQFLLV